MTFNNFFSASCFSLGVMVPGIFAIHLRMQEKNKYKSRYTDLVAELAEKLALGKPIEVVEKQGFGGVAQAQGIALFSGRAGIIIDSDAALSQNEREFVIAHELSHIKNNDSLRLGAAMFISEVTTTFASRILFPSSRVDFAQDNLMRYLVGSPSVLTGRIVGIAVLIMYSKQREKCADLHAFSVCSESVQKSAPYFFERHRLSQLKERNEERDPLLKLWVKFVITKEGNSRFDVMHPSFKAREEYLRKAQGEYLRSASRQ